MRRRWVWTPALPFLAIGATLAVPEVYYRIHSNIPIENLTYRYSSIRLDPQETKTIVELPGTRMRSSFENLNAVRATPLPPPDPYPGLLRADLMLPRPPRLEGDSLTPGKHRSSVRLTNGIAVYDVEVNIDRQGRRETTNPNPERRKRFLLNFGCSFTYGDGVRDSETFSSRLAAVLPGERVYNYGVPGAGPHEVISRLKGLDRGQEIKEADGEAIYLMIPDHIRRAVPSLSHYLERSTRTFYETDEGGELREDRSFYSTHWLVGFLFSLLSRSATLAFRSVNVPLSFGLADLRRVASLVAAMGHLYREKFGNDRFYVVLYPSGATSGIAPLLGEAGVKYLDYERFDLGLYTRNSPVIHARDLHPTAEANDLLARQVKRDLF